MSTATKTSSLALAAAAAALLSGCATMGGDEAAATQTASAEGKCYGVNSCKGTGACATANHSCSGQNACKGQGWVKAMKNDCEAKGGRFEAS